MESSRRDFLRKSALLAAAGIGSQILGNPLQAANAGLPEESFHDVVFELPGLPFEYNAYEPHIDRLTMEIHHTKHHQAYVTNLNTAIKEGHIHIDSLDQLMSGVSKFSPAVRNNGGGHWNHSFFWKLMSPKGGGSPSGKVGEAINQSFGSFDEFKKKINEAGMKRFGSGWAWLVKNKEGKLEIGSTPNQDNPLMDVSDLKGTPILGIDVWEHAYYLKYQNKRADYLSAWWNLINWDQVAVNLG